MAGAFALMLRVEAEGGPEVVDDACRNLSRQLHTSGMVEFPRPETHPAPEGTKSADVFTLGALAIAVAPSFLPALVDYLKLWMSQRANQKVVIELKRADNATRIEFHPDQMSAADIQSLVAVVAATTASPECNEG